MRSPLLLVVSAVVVLGACEKGSSLAETPTKLAIASPPPSSPPPPQAVEIRGAGSTFVNQLVGMALSQARLTPRRPLA